MPHSITRRWVATAALLLVAAGCSAGGDLADEGARRAADAGAGSGSEGFADTGGTGGGSAGDAGSPVDSFVPEEEKFIVEAVASTDDYVFVPNSDEESSTIARIDGRDLSVVPIRVALEPVAVRAADLPDLGAVAYVLSEGKSAVSIVRAEKITKHSDPARQVSILPVPREINAMALAPDGRHVLAYIDPKRPLPSDASVASLQVASLIRVGDNKQEDEAFQLSVSRLVQEVEFTDDGSQAFVVGRDGVNRIVLDQVDSDRFVPPLDLTLSNSAFPPEDREVEVGAKGELLAVRSSQFSGLLLYRPPAPDAGEGATGNSKRISLPEPPTDIDLHVASDGSKTIIASLPQNSKVALVDVAAAFDNSTGSPVEVLDAPGVQPGLAQITPDEKSVLLYTSHGTTPELGVLDLGDQSVRSYPLRNQIESLAVAPNSASAVVVHQKQEGPPPTDASTLEFFQHNYGLTLFDLASGYRRPVTLNGRPASLAMTTGAEDTPLLFAMLDAGATPGGDTGLTRVDLSTYRTDFYSLPRTPEQLGRVAGKIFVSQESEVGRITFFDVDSGERQTVSGYELNAAIE